MDNTEKAAFALRETRGAFVQNPDWLHIPEGQHDNVAYDAAQEIETSIRGLNDGNSDKPLCRGCTMSALFLASLKLVPDRYVLASSMIEAYAMLLDGDSIKQILEKLDGRETSSEDSGDTA